MQVEERKLNVCPYLHTSVNSRIFLLARRIIKCPYIGNAK
jgi:hypothetical protein